MGKYMGTKEASEKWGYTQSQISKWCRERMIEGVEQDKYGSPWRIPIDAMCPKKIKNMKIKK